MKTKTGYSALQISLYWIIAALVGFQLFFGESMTAVVDAAEENAKASPFDQTMASAHYWVGISVLALVVIRFIVRLFQGAPEPTTEWQGLALIAKATHWLFYALLVAMPVSGLLAVYVDGEFGDIHSLGKPVFILMIAAHAVAALFHQLYLRDGTLRRMLVPAR